ncbi:hypothetical protein [Citreimonas salinaria]|uniref:hypothetical protein n=1 Tax=Citreimonas salinaria TaxID=321339 RepID=UPI001C433F4D|nr:hypothetical protein [Citreimonas salinaria]
MINVGELRGVVDGVWAVHAGALAQYRAGLLAFLYRAAVEHEAVRSARIRQSDPAWAHAKAARGSRLHRFYRADSELLELDLEWLLDGLSAVAAAACQSDHPMRNQAAAFLRGFPHRRDDIFAASYDAQRLVERAVISDLRLNRHRKLRNAAVLTAAGLVGVRCRSVADIIALGHEARNCLRWSGSYWRKFAAARIDVWALRRDGRLVAVNELDHSSGRVRSLTGPANARLPRPELRAGLRWCRALSGPYSA